MLVAEYSIKLAEYSRNDTKMCADHRQMMAGRTPEEQQKMMESHVQSMHRSADPKMVAMHRQMMDKHCAQTGPGAK